VRPESGGNKSDNSVTFAGLRSSPNGCRYYRNENKKQSCERSPDPMKTMTFKRPRASHFFSDRYAYRERPNFLPELVGFGIIVVTVIWPIVLVANAIATMK
jgi:hypothetical protein